MDNVQPMDGLDFLSLAVTAVVSYLVLFLLTKLVGNKQISQMTMFDYISGISVGSIAAEMATEPESPLRRAGGWFDLSQLETVVFEHNGNLSFLPREAYRAAQPTDLSLSPKQSVLMTPVIMDGEVLPENLRSVGKDEVWLTKKLREQGYSAFGEVFLALCDGSGEAPQLYPIETKGGQRGRSRAASCRNTSGFRSRRS